MVRSLALRYIVRLVAGFLVVFSLASPTLAQGDNTLEAFRNFVKAGQYEDASFYLKNGLIKPEQIDTSQLFYDVLMERLYRNLQENAGQVSQLFDYLNGVSPINLNQTMACGNNHQAQCLLVNSLLASGNRNAVSYFVDRGLDLNLRVPGVAPATVPLIMRLGTRYTLADLNFFVSKGMVLGDELYPIDELAAYEDEYLRRRELNMPANYLTLDPQNFLDVLIIALGTETDADRPQESARRKLLCDFVAHAAPSFTPSFDYLWYLLKANEDFRGEKIGVMDRYSKNVFSPFPPSCVTLIKGMAASHQQLSDVISQFAGEGEVSTAQWLISIQNGGN